MLVGLAGVVRPANPAVETIRLLTVPRRPSGPILEVAVQVPLALTTAVEALGGTSVDGAAPRTFGPVEPPRPATAEAGQGAVAGLLPRLTVPDRPMTGTDGVLGPTGCRLLRLVPPISLGRPTVIAALVADVVTPRLGLPLVTAAAVPRRTEEVAVPIRRASRTVSTLVVPLGTVGPRLSPSQVAVGAGPPTGRVAGIAPLRLVRLAILSAAVRLPDGTPRPSL